MVSAKMIPPVQPRKKTIPHYNMQVFSLLQFRFGILLKSIFFIAWGISLFIGFPIKMGWIWWALPIRSIPILVSAVCIIILRKYNLYVEKKEYPSLFLELWNKFKFSLRKGGFIQVSFMYSVCSIFYFCLIKYNMHDIGITTKKLNANSFELPRLNERYLYITLLPIYIAIGYSINHIVYDYDYLKFTSYSEGLNLTAFQKMKRETPSTLVRCGISSLIVNITFPIVYWLFRKIIWNNSLFFVKYVLLFKVHRSGEYLSFPFGMEFFLIGIFSSFFLLILWESANIGFDSYMTLGPLHKGILISTKTNDPNGTLITGLRATRRPLTRLLAFEELLYIAINDTVRRSSIYSDIEREIDQFRDEKNKNTLSNTTSIWAEIYGECKLVVEDITKRVSDINNSNSKKLEKQKDTNTPPTLSSDIHNHQTNQFKSINSTSNAISSHIITLKRDNIFLPQNSSNKTNLKTKLLIDNFQDKDGQRSKEAVAFVTKTKSTFQNFLSQYKSLLKSILAKEAGAPFRYTLERQTNALIPNVVICKDALLSLSLFVANSLEEDTLGTVQRYIPDILALYHNFIRALETYIADPPKHWSNPPSIYTPEYIISSTGTLGEILETAEASFECIIIAFEPYLGSLNIPEPVLKHALQIAESLEI